MKFWDWILAIDWEWVGFLAVLCGLSILLLMLLGMPLYKPIHS